MTRFCLHPFTLHSAANAPFRPVPLHSAANAPFRPVPLHSAANAPFRQKSIVCSYGFTFDNFPGILLLPSLAPPPLPPASPSV